MRCQTGVRRIKAGASCSRESPEFSNPDVWPDTPYIHFSDEIAFVVAGLFQGDGDRLSIA